MDNTIRIALEDAFRTISNLDWVQKQVHGKYALKVDEPLQRITDALRLLDSAMLSAAPALPTAPADTSADEAMSDTPAMPELLIKSLKNTIVIVRRHFGLPDVSPNGGGDLLYALNASAAPALTTDSADALKKRNSEQEPVGWLYGNSYWSRDNQRITDHIKEHGRALYDRPAHQGVQAISAQSTQTDEVAKDAERFAWWFSDRDKCQFLLRYMDGCREHWTIDQWRAAIDSAIEQGKDGGV